MRNVQILALFSIAALGLSCSGQPGERALTAFGNGTASGRRSRGRASLTCGVPWKSLDVGDRGDRSRSRASRSRSSSF